MNNKYNYKNPKLECKKGYIHKDGYITLNGVVVPKCIKSTSIYGIKAEDVTTPIINKMLRR